MGLHLARERRDQKTNMIDLSSTGLRRSARLDNGLFSKLSLAVVEACEEAKKTQLFITRSNQHIQEIISNFDETLNHFGPMVFVENQ